ncbi:hypothetical protein GCM10007879_09810 [Maritalea porphyrae]|uniref:DUF1800 family protein n=2 Tax=Maritalea porphyrae TaxID=880732 RepID=A0ABQ5US03_9HYPH|nr:hypothetical protein GCM10007879_09810 [Maritalea porphyrae]
MAFSTGASCAQELDGVAQVVEGNSAKAVQFLTDQFAQSNEPLNWQNTFLLTYALWQDNRLEPIEQDFLREFASANPSVMVTLGDGSEIEFPPGDEQAKYIAGLLADTPNLNEWWLVDQTAMSNLAIVAYTGDAAWNRIVNFFASKFYVAWQESNIGNGYKPIRDLLVQTYQFYDKEGRINYSGRGLIFDAMAVINDHVNDAVPSFIYNWIEPKPAPYRPYDRLLETQHEQQAPDLSGATAKPGETPDIGAVVCLPFVGC